VVQFDLDRFSGLSPYQQVIKQIRHALLLGLLRKGDQLPTVKQLATDLAINPNTVLKAYRELEYDGLDTARPGIGTFVHATLADASFTAQGPLREELHRWINTARRAGVDDESIEALFTASLRATRQEIRREEP
jgi:GntR family transcriptional regulator